MEGAGAGDARPHRGGRRAGRPVHLRDGRVRARDRPRDGGDRALRHRARPLDARRRHAGRPQPRRGGLLPRRRVRPRRLSRSSGLDGRGRDALPLRPRRDRWRRQPSAPTERGALAVGVVGHRLYAVGGAERATGRCATLEIYDLRGGAGAPGRRHAAGPRAPGGRGGGRAASTRWRAARRAAGTTTSSRRSTLRAVAGARRPPWRRRAAASERRRSAGRIVVVGGEEAAGTIREVELLDPARAAGAASPTCRRRATGSASSRAATASTRSRAATGRASRSPPRSRRWRSPGSHAASARPCA